MRNRGRIGEKIAIFIILLVLVGFLGSFGYLVKTELIDGNGKLSYSIKQKTEEKKKNVENKKNSSDDALATMNEKEEVNTSDTSFEKEDDTDKISDSNKVDNTDIQLPGDGKEYKVYPIVTCKASDKIDDTEVSLNEEYNFYFDTDGSMNWIKYDLSIDYSKYPEVYEAFLESGYFDLMNEEFKDVAIATSITKSKYSLSFELKPKDFIDDVDDSPFKTIDDLHYDRFEKIIKNEGYTCVSE